MVDWNRLFGLGGIAAAGGLLTGEAYQRLGEIGEQARREASELAQTQLQQTQFQPFTVTTGTGGVLQTTPEGGLGVMLAPQEQATDGSAYVWCYAYARSSRSSIWSR
jgi:hypothetical protein